MPSRDHAEDHSRTTKKRIAQGRNEKSPSAADTITPYFVGAAQDAPREINFGCSSPCQYFRESSMLQGPYGHKEGEQMKLTAIGLLELNSVAQGLLVADSVIKTAEIKLLKAQAVCPGKYLIIMGGEIGAVSSALEVGLAKGGNMIVDYHLFGNMDPVVARAMLGVGEVPQGKSMGIIETFTVAAAIVGADAAVKAADVDLVDIRIACGLGGKSYAVLSGEVASVEAAVAVVRKNLQEIGPLANVTVIPAPYPELWEIIV
jgi:microcompartment protein CcmL/EutN